MRLLKALIVWAAIVAPLHAVAGTPTFSRTTTYRLSGRHPAVVAVGDVDGDGRADVVAGERLCGQQCGLLVMLQADDGLRQPLLYQAWEASAIAIADVNSDSLNDVVLSLDPYWCDVLVYSQGANHVLAAPKRLTPPRCSYDIDIADVTGDGRADIVALPWGSNTDDMYVYEQRQGSDFLRRDLTMAGAGYDDLEVGLLDGDPYPDAVVVSGQGVVGRVSIRYGSAAQIFSHASTLDIPESGLFGNVDIADMNGDQKSDLVVTSAGSPGRGYPFVAVLEQRANREFVPALFLRTPPWPRGMTLNDLNGDQRPDIAVVGTYGRSGYVAQVWIQEERPNTFRLEEYALPSIGANYFPHDQVAVGDVTADGAVDVVIALDGGAIVVLGTAPTDIPAVTGSVLVLLLTGLAVIAVWKLR